MRSFVWIIGSPRSGTSLITDYVGLHADYCFNEPWGIYPLGKHLEWTLPADGSIVFKYCANCFHYKQIKERFENSKWVHVIREPIHVIYSMFFPKNGSHPERPFEEMGNDPDERIKNVYVKWKSILTTSLNIDEAHIVNYEKINIGKLANFLEIGLTEPLDFKNRNTVFDKDKMIELKDLLKKHNLDKEVEIMTKEVSRKKMYL